MERLHKAVGPGYIEDTLQAWEEMRLEILHEIQNGGVEQEEALEVAYDIEAHSIPWPVRLPALTHPGKALQKEVILPDEVKN